MNTRAKTILAAVALIATASTLSAQAADDVDASPVTAYGLSPSPSIDQVEGQDQQDQDQAITDDVVYAISSDESLSGEIAVETLHDRVTLTGLVDNPDQVDAAERDARSVDDVKDVRNYVRARTGD